MFGMLPQARFARAFRGFAGNYAPNFSPLSDAVKREREQVGSMMGISPSSVQTRVVQNSSLKSPFNPQGFGVISPTVGQNSFADAARMHRGEDLRTTNLPNFAFGDVGVIDVTLKRRGRDDYTYTVESLEWDNINASTPAIAPNYLHTIPVYDRNINTTVFLKSNHPSPATIHSMNWEGDYSPRYYQRV